MHDHVRIVAKTDSDSLKTELDKRSEECSLMTSQLQAAKGDLSQSQKALADHQQEVKQLRHSVQSLGEEKEKLNTQGILNTACTACFLIILEFRVACLKSCVWLVLSLIYFYSPLFVSICHTQIIFYSRVCSHSTLTGYLGAKIKFSSHLFYLLCYVDMYHSACIVNSTRDSLL